MASTEAKDASPSLVASHFIEQSIIVCMCTRTMKSRCHSLVTIAGTVGIVVYSDEVLRDRQKNFTRGRRENNVRDLASLNCPYNKWYLKQRIICM